jgi:RNA polymerase sigma-70 factor (ECF subfamily)
VVGRDSFLNRGADDPVQSHIPADQAIFQRDLVALVPKLRRFALSLSGDQADADDLVQAACEKALRGADQFTPGTRMDSWMYRIIQTGWLDDRRKTVRHGTLIDPEDAFLSDEGKAAALPHDRLILARARAAMADLPEGQREVLALVGIEGLSYREVANTLDMPIGTVMSRLARARQALMPKL